jgi:pimeloyl-ACP methyl ester carboxylesterase
MASVTVSESLKLSDGRSLDVRVSGPEGGTPLLFHHGTPGAVPALRDMERFVHERGLRLVTTSRPGYGTSARQRGRRVVDVVADSAEVLAWLGAHRCLSAGWSGGGPHALACAARLDAVAGVLVIAGVAPYDSADLNFLDGMGEGNIKEFSAALEGEGPLREYLEPHLGHYRTITADEVVASLSSVLPDVDRTALSGNIGLDLATQFHSAFEVGIDGMVDDDLAFTQPWGFDLHEITVPTMIWQGELDLMVPFAHGQWLASKLPHASVHLESGEGHLSVGVGSLEQMLDELVEVL